MKVALILVTAFACICTTQAQKKKDRNEQQGHYPSYGGYGYGYNPSRCMNRYAICAQVPRMYCYHYWWRLACPQICDYFCQDGGDWGPYGKWGKCSKPCGTGVQKRKRKCKSNNCRGSDEQIRRCNKHQCQGGKLVEGVCSVSCGKGVMFAVVNGARVYSSCNTAPCPQIQCDPGEIFRKEDPEYNCCKPVQSSCGVPSIANIPFGTPRVLLGANVAPRIFGGQPVLSKEFPWFAAIALAGINSCGGSIVSRRFILTAGHCIVDDTTNIPFDINTMAVIVGRTFIAAGDPELTNYNVKRAWVPEKHVFPFHDIGLIKLKQNLQFNDHVMPICLRQFDKPTFDSTCFIAGHGLTEAFTSSEQLLYADLEIYRTEVCEVAFPNLFDANDYYREKVICAGKLISSQDSCNGDSGTPLVCQRRDTCEWYVAGVTSAGGSMCASPKQPAMYTSVSHYWRWIMQTMQL